MSTAGIPSAMSLEAPDARARRWAAYIQAGVLSILLLVLFWHEVRRLVVIWQTQSNWSHGFVVPLFSLYFLYVHRERLQKTPPRTSLWGLPVLLGGLALYFVSIYVLQMGYPKSVAMIVCIFGLTLYRCGWQVMRIVWVPILYLMFAIPLPESLYVNLTMPLRRLASHVAAMLLSLIPELEATVSGVTIDMIYRHTSLTSLNVADACSGMRVMIGLCALGVAIAYVGERPNWQRIVLVLFCVPIAVFTNLLRVTTTGVFYVKGWKYLTDNAGHTAWGMVMYGVALCWFFLLSYILAHLVVDDPEAGPPSAG